MRGCLSFIVLLGGCLGLLAQNAGTSNAVPATVRPLQAKGIENFYQLSGRIYSGSAPEGEAAFASLQKLGVKTIITVDGAKPDVETAAKYGIRYIHLPIGYDGVPVEQGLRMVKAAETVSGPIFVHCHHGLHRGPAGAAVICMGTEGWTPEQGGAWLKLAGTATNYAGLYKSVEQFRAPSPEALKKVSADFPSKSDVSPLADVMIQVDERFDHLKLIKKAGYRQPPANPDLDPAHEALLLDELFRELRRSPITEKRTPDFLKKLAGAEAAAETFHRSMTANPLDAKQADAAFQQLNDACAACHKNYRNRRG